MNRKMNYWAIRTDRHNKKVILDELKQGRIRQGWGFDRDQDLRIIKEEIDEGGGWRKRLSETQKKALPSLKMLTSVRTGDLLLLANLPRDGYFYIAEVTGDYYFEPLQLSEEQDVHGMGQDYGHVIPVKLLTDNEKGINKHSGQVDASLRRTLKARNRMWSLDGYGALLENILDYFNKGVDLTTSKPGKERLESAWEKAVEESKEQLIKKLENELDSSFQAAEWEEPIKIALQHLYPGSDVESVGGPKESGIDLVIKIPNHFIQGALDWLILVQVKNYSGEISCDVFNQIKEFQDRYASEGEILYVLIMTTADKISLNYNNKEKDFSEEYSVQVDTVLREDMMRIIADGLFYKMSFGKKSLSEE